MKILLPFFFVSFVSSVYLRSGHRNHLFDDDGITFQGKNETLTDDYVLALPREENETLTDDYVLKLPRGEEEDTIVDNYVLALPRGEEEDKIVDDYVLALPRGEEEDKIVDDYVLALPRGEEEDTIVDDYVLKLPRGEEEDKIVDDYEPNLGWVSIKACMAQACETSFALCFTCGPDVEVESEESSGNEK